MQVRNKQVFSFVHNDILYRVCETGNLSRHRIGCFDSKTNTIYIDTKANKEMQFIIFVHELCHAQSLILGTEVPEKELDFAGYILTSIFKKNPAVLQYLRYLQGAASYTKKNKSLDVKVDTLVPSLSIAIASVVKGNKLLIAEQLSEKIIKFCFEQFTGSAGRLKHRKLFAYVLRMLAELEPKIKGWLKDNASRK